MTNDVRTEQKANGLRRGSQMSGLRRWFLYAGLMMSAVTVLSVMTVGITLADDQPLPPITIGYQSGVITAIYETTLDIDGRTYGLMPDVVMLDQFGWVLDSSRLVVTAEVKFHVKKEQSGKIDRMIVTLPR